MSQKILFVAREEDLPNLGSFSRLLTMEGYEVEQTSVLEKDSSIDLVIAWGPAYWIDQVIFPTVYEGGIPTILISRTGGPPEPVMGIKWLKAPVRPSKLLEVVHEVLA